MLKRELCKYLKQDTVKLANYRQFCKDACNSEMSLTEQKAVKIKTGVFPIPANGFVAIMRKKRKRRYRMVLNLTPYYFSKNFTPEKKFFYLYVTLIHELEHVRLLENNEIESFPQLLAYWEEVRELSVMRVVDALSDLLMVNGKAKWKKKQYRLSLAELYCNTRAYEKGLALFHDYLPPEDIEIIQLILKSLYFLQESVSITYSRTDAPYSAFVKMLFETQAVLNKKRHFIVTPEGMRVLFHENGTIKNMEELYHERTEQNQKLIDGLLIHLFIHGEADYKELFAALPELRDFIQELGKKYIQDVISYLTNIDLGSVFLQEQELQDNAAMLIKNADRVSKLMDTFEMEHSDCGIIPLYQFTC